MPLSTIDCVKTLSNTPHQALNQSFSEATQLASSSTATEKHLNKKLKKAASPIQDGPTWPHVRFIESPDMIGKGSNALTGQICYPKFKSFFVMASIEAPFVLGTLPKVLRIIGHAQPEHTWKYIMKAKENSDIGVVRFIPVKSNDNESYQRMADYLNTQRRYGFVKPDVPSIRNICIISLAPNEPLPKELTNILGGAGVINIKSHILLGLIVGAHKPPSPLTKSSSQLVNTRSDKTIKNKNSKGICNSIQSQAKPVVVEAPTLNCPSIDQKPARPEAVDPAINGIGGRTTSYWFRESSRRILQNRIDTSYDWLYGTDDESSNDRESDVDYRPSASRHKSCKPIRKRRSTISQDNPRQRL